MPIFVTIYIALMLWGLFPEDIEDVSGVSKNISGKTRYTYFDKLLNNDRDVDDFKSQICDVITSGDSYCINCENNIPHTLNADIMSSEVKEVLKNLKIINIQALMDYHMKF